MQYRKMGRTGLKVSSFCLGTMTFGRPVEEKEAIKIVHAAIDEGVNFIDTADMYANGVTEDIVAKAIVGKRDSLVLASKGGHIRKLDGKYGEALDCGPMDMARPRAFHSWPAGKGVGHNDMGLSRKHIMQAVEGSLKRLNTDYLDLYYAHMPDYATPLDETLRAMDDLVRQGKVRYVGCSNFRAYQLSKALWISDKLNLARWDFIQPPYNLLARDVEYELLPLCDEEGVGVCVFSPMAAGFLSGKYKKDEKPIEGARFSLTHLGYRYNQTYWDNTCFAAVEKLAHITDDLGLRLPEFALAWVLSNKTITSIVCGASNVEHLKQNMTAVDITLPQEALDACDAIWHDLRPRRLFYGR